MAQSNLTEWDQDLTTSPDEEYESLVRAIRWARGFGLLFVQCSPAEGEKLIEQVRQDIPEKVTDLLRLDHEIDDLHEIVAAHPGIQQTNVLFITGLEKSLVAYIKPGYGSEGSYYAKDIVPKLLGKLNLQRERFKEDFKLCFVFLVPRFAMKYLIRRAADFFDWRSGVWEFVSPQAARQQETQHLLQDNDYNHYLRLTPQQRRQRFLTIEDLLAEGHPSPEESSELCREQGRLLNADQDFKSAIIYYDQALAINPDYHEALNNKGTALSALGQQEAAIACYDQALAINPDDHQALNNKGLALSALGQQEAAIACYDQALAINPDLHQALNNKGTALSALGQQEAAIACYDQALAIKPDDHHALDNRGYALTKAGFYSEAISSFDQAIKLNPSYANAIYNKAFCLSLMGDLAGAFDHLRQSFEIDPQYREMAKTDTDFDPIRGDERFRAVVEGGGKNED
jgi:tetratricopeptide (TPR) repeat protein